MGQSAGKRLIYMGFQGQNIFLVKTFGRKIHTPADLFQDLQGLEVLLVPTHDHPSRQFKSDLKLLSQGRKSLGASNTLQNIAGFGMSVATVSPPACIFKQIIIVKPRSVSLFLAFALILFDCKL
jgi:hypothetical protein